MKDLIAGDYGHASVEVQERQSLPRAFHVPTRRDRKRHVMLRQSIEQLAHARKRTNRPDLPRVGLRVLPLDPLDLILRHRPSDLSQQRMEEQPAAHTDLPVNAPDGQLDPDGLKGLPPCQNILVDAVHQRPV